MIRKSLLLVFSIFVVLSCSVPLLAQESWEWVSFTGQREIFTYEITHYSEEWYRDTREYVRVENKQYMHIDLQKLDDEKTEIFISYTYRVPTSELWDEFSYMGLGGLSAFTLSGGAWFGEFSNMSFFAADLDLIEGRIVEFWDGSWVRVIDKREVNGIEGYYITKSYDESEGGELISEWIIAPNVPMPLFIKVYEDGEVTVIVELVEYLKEL